MRLPAFSALRSLGFSLPLALALGLPALRADEPPGTVNPEGNTGVLKAQITTGGAIDPHSGNATRTITDLTVPGALSAYGLSVVRYWESLRETASIDYGFALPHGSGGWTNNWTINASMSWDYVDAGDGSYAQIRLTMAVAMPDGRVISFQNNRNDHDYAPILDELPPYTGRRSEVSPPKVTPIQSWSTGSTTSTDFMGEMDPWGRWFWIMRGDGGSILFATANPTGAVVQGVAEYRPVEMRDPHGVPTRFVYGTNGLLSKVVDASGRTLHFGWVTPAGTSALVLGWVGWTKAENDDPGPSGQFCIQRSFYTYGQFAGGSNGFVALTGARTLASMPPAPASPMDDPEMSFYRYRWMTPTQSGHYPGPALRVAKDPRFAGPMQKIRYRYSGEVVECPVGNPPTPPGGYPGNNEKLSNFRPDYYAVYEEQAWDGNAGADGNSGSIDTDGPVLARLWIPCNGSTATGTRVETNGIGGTRIFYFGRRGGYELPPYWNMGFQMTRVTDYTGTDATSVRQYYGFSSDVEKFYDARGTLNWLGYSPGTTKVASIYRSGSDGSVATFNYTSPGASAQPHPILMKNSVGHWLFSKTDERGFVTTVTRDAQRRVQSIAYPGGAGESFGYTTQNLTVAKTDPSNRTLPSTIVFTTESVAVSLQTATHVLPSGATEYRTYDERHRLTSTYNSVDGVNEKVEYTYYDVSAGDPAYWQDLLKTVRNYRARTNGAPFTAKFEYNSRQQITRVYYPATDGTSNHPFVQYDYDNFGRCWKITDEEGHWRIFSFDDYGRCTQLEEQLAAPGPDGNGTVASRKWNWIYDRIGYAAEAHTSKQWRVQIEPSYNMAGRRRLTAQYFDVNDRITAVQTGWTADANGNNWVAEPEMVTSYAAYDVVGNKTSTTDPLGRVTTMTYDLRNRQLTVTDPLNQTTTTAYNTTGQKTLVTFPDGKTQQFLDIDAFGQAWRTIDERNNTTNLEYGFGPMKKLTKVTTTRDKDAGGTESQVTTFQYDAMARETVRWFPDGTCEENAIGWGGEVVAHKMRRGRWQWFHRDVRQRDIWSWWDNASDAGLQPVARVWDKASRLTSIANDVSTITYTYDAAGQVLTENNNIAGGPSGGRTQTYHRYGNGAVSRLGYPGGSWFQRNYNARGELISLVQVSPGTPGWSWTAAEFFYYADGKPSWTNRGNGASSRYFYDGKGNLSVSEHFQALGGLYYAGGTTVLTAGQALTRGRYYFTLQGDGNLVLYENGTPRWATGTNNGAQLIMQSDGNLVLYTAGGSAAWATWTQGNPGAQFVFQEDGNLVVYAAGWQTKWHSNTAGQMAGSVARRDYSRDNRDRIVAISKGTVSGNLVENGRSDRFVYDAEGQLTDAYYDAQYASGPVSGQAREDHFVYDQLGNRKTSNWGTWTRRDTTQQNPNMNGLNQIKTWGGAPANWDDQWNIGNGNLIQDGTFTAWYNALNQPMWSSTTSTPAGYANFYAYDPLGRCVKRWYALNNPTGAAVTNNPATYFYYEGWNLIEEADGNATLAQIYLHGARVDEIVARYRYADAKWYFHHYDGRTHCQVVTTNNAAVAEQYQYDAFGWPYLYTAAGAQLTLVNGRPVSAIGNRFLFTGREWLTDWGVYDYRHRQYHPKMGRFIQPDPKHFAAGDYNLTGIATTIR